MCIQVNQRTAAENKRLIDMNTELLEHLETVKKPGEINQDDSRAMINYGKMMGLSEPETIGTMGLLILCMMGEPERELIKRYVSEITRI